MHTENMSEDDLDGDYQRCGDTQSDVNDMCACCFRQIKCGNIYEQE